MRKLSDPLVVDRWTDAATALTWILFGSWALLYMIGAATRGQSLVSDLVGYLAALIWAATLATSCFACATWALIVMSAANGPRRLRAARLEQATSLVAIFFALAYTIWELARLITDPSWGASASFALALYYPLWPWWRFHALRKRMQAIAATIPE